MLIQRAGLFYRLAHHMGSALSLKYLVALRFYRNVLALPFWYVIRHLGVYKDL